MARDAPMKASDASATKAAINVMVAVLSAVCDDRRTQGVILDSPGHDSPDFKTLVREGIGAGYTAQRTLIA